MYILSVDNPPVTRWSVDSSSHTPTPSLATQVTPLAASLYVDCYHDSFSPDTWMFDRLLATELATCSSLGVGDAIAVYRQTEGASASEGFLPAFTGCLTHIVGWGPSSVEFGVKDDSPYPSHPTTIQIPLHLCRLSILQLVWGWLFPWLRCLVNRRHPPPLPPPSASRGSANSSMVWRHSEVSEV
ncbi:hypothetical protein C8R48DRAFT_777425 [Suillus tomentosus]|nr:hypothetical protein C8R48DRAFT_777425 [Suillus tomentosus]